MEMLSRLAAGSGCKDMGELLKNLRPKEVLELAEAVRPSLGSEQRETLDGLLEVLRRLVAEAEAKLEER